MNRKGCESIPYDDLRSTCKSKSSEVADWCKGGRGKWSCDELDPSGLTKQIENVKRKIEDLKREKDELSRKKSDAKDDSERRELEDSLAAKERDIYELEKKVEEWERRLSDEKRAANDRIYIGEQCHDARQNVARVFESAKGRARSETDSEIKPYADRLASSYEAEERGHAEAIDFVRRGIEKCKSMR
ncbi:MAG TPA: hypothetical protein VN253_07095 [Kofleriaceae bacterium]|nr:hypothetical protein [Kofleriaceae bacterium]